jgi:hypothetical protein
MILGDSGDYELLTQGVQAIIKDPNDTYSLSLEIGVREGAGSLTILWKPLILIIKTYPLIISV